MYEKDGQSYFVVDSHMHYWDASPANWVKGHEEYAKGWIECFHAYQSLGPPETHWSIEKFQKYSEEDTMADLFDRGHVDVAISQPTYLTSPPLRLHLPSLRRSTRRTKSKRALARSNTRTAHRARRLSRKLTTTST